jgi:SH3-like domain-containing protein
MKTSSNDFPKKARLPSFLIVAYVSIRSPPVDKAVDNELGAFLRFTISVFHRRILAIAMACSVAFPLRNGLIAVLALLFAVLGGQHAQAQQTGSKLGPSGLPLPRFASLKSDEVNVRKGPGHDHAIAWVFHRAGLPVEIIAEYDVWRQVRDSEGATGWVYGRMLSGRRTVLVAPWSKQPQQTFTLLASASTGSGIIARVQPGVLGDVLSCGKRWCNLAIGDVKGWLQRDHLWGIYPNETVN